MGLLTMDLHELWAIGKVNQKLAKYKRADKLASLTQEDAKVVYKTIPIELTEALGRLWKVKVWRLPCTYLNEALLIYRGLETDIFNARKALNSPCIEATDAQIFASNILLKTIESALVVSTMQILKERAEIKCNSCVKGYNGRGGKGYQPCMCISNEVKVPPRKP